jgi:hypothetical protein
MPIEIRKPASGRPNAAAHKGGACQFSVFPRREDRVLPLTYYSRSILASDRRRTMLPATAA